MKPVDSYQFPTILPTYLPISTSSRTVGCADVARAVKDSGHDVLDLVGSRPEPYSDGQRRKPCPEIPCERATLVVQRAFSGSAGSTAAVKWMTTAAGLCSPTTGYAPGPSCRRDGSQWAVESSRRGVGVHHRAPTMASMASVSTMSISMGEVVVNVVVPIADDVRFGVHYGFWPMGVSASLGGVC